MQLELLRIYKPFMEWQERYTQLIGGFFRVVNRFLRFTLPNKILLFKVVCYSTKKHFLMVRNTIKAVAESIWDTAQRNSIDCEIEHLFKFLKNPYRIICTSTNSMATAFGCMEGANSEFGSLTKGKKGIAEITDALIDEADSFVLCIAFCNAF